MAEQEQAKIVDALNKKFGRGPRALGPERDARREEARRAGRATTQEWTAEDQARADARGPQPKPVKGKKPGAMPPSWAPAHGLRRKYKGEYIGKEENKGLAVPGKHKGKYAGPDKYKGKVPPGQLKKRIGKAARRRVGSPVAAPTAPVYKTLDSKP